jgi:D-serine deaminase-like pyridoxal phosphate-dependent protein
LLQLHRRLRGEGIVVGEIVTSGTPTFLQALDHAPFSSLDGVAHRVSPGTAVYHDLRSEREIPELELRPAALVLTRVISRPSPGIVTCDAGSKALAAEAGDPCAFVLGRPDLEPQRPNEEHLPLRVDPRASTPERGAALYLVPTHVCPTVNLAEEAILVEGGRVVDVVPVSARARDGQNLGEIREP